MATLIGSLTMVLTSVMALSGTASAWTRPGHMLSAVIGYQVLQQALSGPLLRIIPHTNERFIRIIVFLSKYSMYHCFLALSERCPNVFRSEQRKSL
jgi:hypothetical protein